MTDQTATREGPEVRRRVPSFLVELSYLAVVVSSLGTLFVATSSFTAPSPYPQLLWSPSIRQLEQRNTTSPSVSEGSLRKSRIQSPSEVPDKEESSQETNIASSSSSVEGTPKSRIRYPIEVVWVPDKVDPKQPIFHSAPSARIHIWQEDAFDYHIERNLFLDQMDGELDYEYYRNEELDEDYFQQQECVRPSWIWDYYPSCNHVHEISIPDSMVTSAGDNSTCFLGQGAYRQAWRLRQAGDTSTGSAVLKTTRTRGLKTTDNMVQQMRKVQTEAIIMERLSPSDRIIDIFGHCGGSILVEAGTDIYEDIVPDQDRPQVKSEQLLIKLQKDKLLPQNNLTAEEKLDMALAMAEGIAAMHGHEGGVMVNSDIHIEQWVRSQANGQPKLNDFNNGFFLEWNPKTQQYCSEYVSFGGDFHSPEEFRGEFAQEHIDVYSMGNNIHCLLTGLWQFPWLKEDGDVQDLVIAGKRDHVDPRYKTRSYIEGRLVEIMERAWVHDPKKRATIFEVVEHLRETKRVQNEQAIQTPKETNSSVL